MRIGQINPLIPENNLNNLMNFTSKDIIVKDLEITIGVEALSYNQYWKKQYNENAIQNNSVDFCPDRIRAFKTAVGINSKLVNTAISAQAINIDYKATTVGSTHFEAQMLYLFKELYNIFGEEVFPNGCHFNTISNEYLRPHITIIKDCLESILFLYWSGNDAMKILVKQTIKEGDYDQCPQGFTKNIETAVSKLIADSEVSAMKFLHLEEFIKVSLGKENLKAYGPNQLSRGVTMEVHDAKSVLKQLSIDFKLAVPIVRAFEWTDTKFTRFVEKVKKAHPYIKNHIKQIPDGIVHTITTDDQDAFKKSVQHKTNFFYWEDCFKSCYNDNWEINNEKLKFFLKINMAGSGFIDHFAYKFSFSYMDENNQNVDKDYLYVKGYNIDAASNLTIKDDSGVIVSYVEANRDLSTHNVTPMKINSIREFSDTHLGFNIDAVDFTELFVSRRGEAAIRDYYDAGFLANIEAARFAGCTEQELRTTFAGNDEALTTINNFIIAIPANPDMAQFLNNHLASTLIYLADINGVDISKLNISSPIMNDPEWVRNIDPLQEPIGIPEIDFGVPNNGVAINQILADVAPFVPAVVDPQILQEQMHLRALEDFGFHNNLLNNPAWIALRNEAGEVQLNQARNFLEAHAHLRDEAIGIQNAQGQLQGLPHNNHQNQEVMLRDYGDINDFNLQLNTSKVLNSDVASKLGKESKDIYNDFDSQYLADYVNNKLAIQVAQIKGSYVGNDLKQHLAQEIADDHHSTSSNSNSWDKFDDAVLAGHFALEIEGF